MNKINKICKNGTEKESIYLMSKILLKEYFSKKHEFNKFINTFIKFSTFFEWNNCDKNLVFDLIILEIKNTINFNKKLNDLLRNKLNLDVIN